MSGTRLHFLLFLLPALAVAQEPSGLEKARQDIKSLPAVRQESERAEVRLPNITAPGPDTAAVPPPAAPAARRESATTPAKAETSGNWLVDAMMKEEAKSAKAAGLTADRRRDDPLAKGEDAAAGDGVDRGLRSAESPLSVTNPLEPFMTEWISQRDRALLLPKSTSGSGRSGGGFAPAPALGDAVTITFRSVDPRSEAAAAPANAAPNENPFLQALLPPPGRSIEPPAPPANPPPAAGNPALGAPEPARDTRPPPPIDLSKPSDDKKYFPQLKRF